MSDESFGRYDEDGSLEAGCPFRAAVKRTRSNSIFDTENKPEMKRLFGLGKQDVQAFLADSGLECLELAEQLHVVAALVITSFCDYVRDFDSTHEGEKVSLDDLLTQWGALVDGLEEDAYEKLVLNKLDSLRGGARIPKQYMDEIAENLALSHPSFVLFLLGFRSLEKKIQANDWNATTKDLMRFIAAEANTHVLDPHRNFVHSVLSENDALEEQNFSYIRFRIWLILKTRGLIFSKGLISQILPRLNLYKILRERRKGCPLLLAGEIRFLVEREIGDSVL